MARRLRCLFPPILLGALALVFCLYPSERRATLRRGEGSPVILAEKRCVSTSNRRSERKSRVQGLRGGGQTLSAAYSYGNLTLKEWWFGSNSTYLGDIHRYFMLAGDVGGTNARLAIYAVSPQELEAGGVSTEVYGRKYKVRDFNSLAAVLNQFLRDAEADQAISLTEYLQIKSRRYPTTACFAVAGPVDSNEVKFTNVRKWPIIRGLDLERQLGIQKVQLLNDFCALSEGVITTESLGMIDTHTLQKFPTIQKSRRGMQSILVIGAGTGLGECQLIWNGKYYESWASEGGHVDFSPKGEIQSQLLEYMRLKYNSTQGGSLHISVEKLCCGQGIADIYEFLRKTYPEQVDPKANAEYESAVEKPVVVTEYGKHAKGTLMNQALEIFLEIYGSEVGNAALKFLPFGGIYIGGGIAPNLKEYMEKSSTFLSALRDKGQMSGLVRQMPVKMILSDGIAIRGAETVARRKLLAFLEDNPQVFANLPLAPTNDFSGTRASIPSRKSRGVIASVPVRVPMSEETIASARI